MVARLSGEPLRLSSDNRESMGVAVFGIESGGQTFSDRILEIVTPAPVTELSEILNSYWQEYFPDSLTIVAEFDLDYEPRQARVFRLGEQPREFTLQMQGSMEAKVQARSVSIGSCATMILRPVLSSIAMDVRSL